MKANGAEKLFSKMIDREYAEMADLPEELIYEEIIDDEQTVDEEKDNYYYQNRISKGYGLTDNPIKGK